MSETTTCNNSSIGLATTIYPNKRLRTIIVPFTSSRTTTADVDASQLQLQSSYDASQHLLTTETTFSSIASPEEEPSSLVSSSISRMSHFQERRNLSSTDSNKNDSTNDENDTFLASMTFASSTERSIQHQRQYCDDCDECNWNGTTSSSGGGGALYPSNIPESIRVAINEYQRTIPIRRYQHRTMLQRCACIAVNCSCNNMTVWQLVLPVQAAEPLIEFGNASIYRIVWVQRLRRDKQIRTIGTGIVGSRNEENSRVSLSWNHDDVRLLSSNDGNAVGWVVDETNNNKTNNHTNSIESGPTIFIIVKIPKAIWNRTIDTDKLCGSTNQEEASSQLSSCPEWSRTIASICIGALQGQKKIDVSTNNAIDGCDGIQLSNDDADLFRETVRPFLM